MLWALISRTRLNLIFSLAADVSSSVAVAMGTQIDPVRIGSAGNSMPLMKAATDWTAASKGCPVVNTFRTCTAPNSQEFSSLAAVASPPHAEKRQQRPAQVSRAMGSRFASIINFIGTVSGPVGGRVWPAETNRSP
jgi:hypothetical protein